MTDGSHRCPDCGQEFAGAAALVDHALVAHVEPPAAHIRAPRFPWVGKAVSGLVVLLGVLLVGGLVFAIATGDFDKDTVPETPSSDAHKIAVKLVETGDADDFRAVEPNGGWDTEYEIDGDGEIRVKNESEARPEMEIFALSGDLEDAMEREAKRYGYEFED